MIRYIFLYYYDFYLFCSMVYFKILTKWEAQILIYLLLTVWQKSLNVPLFCMQISIPAFRASYSSLHCVGDKSTGEAKALSFGKKLAEFYISLHKFQDSPTHIQFLLLNCLCLNKILWSFASCCSHMLFCQSKHYTQLSGIIINTYTGAALLFVMSNLTTQHSAT